MREGQLENQLPTGKEKVLSWIPVLIRLWAYPAFSARLERRFYTFRCRTMVEIRVDEEF